jgi:hypothetical protein
MVQQPGRVVCRYRLPGGGDTEKSGVLCDSELYQQACSKDNNLQFPQLWHKRFGSK